MVMVFFTQDSCLLSVLSLELVRLIQRRGYRFRDFTHSGSAAGTALAVQWSLLRHEVGDSPGGVFGFSVEILGPNIP